MVKTSIRLVINFRIIIMIVFVSSYLFGCGGGGGENDTPNNTDETPTNQSENELNRLECDKMLSEAFMSSHSLSIESYNLSDNPMEGFEEIGTFCTIRKDGQRISDLSALNSNSTAYDSVLAKLQIENNMVEDNSVGTYSAYTYRTDSETDKLLAFIFLGSNNATTVSLTHLLPMGLKETKELAQEIDSNLPAISPAENTAPDYQCPDMISESDLVSILGQEIAYESLTPTNIASNLGCTFVSPETTEFSEQMSGDISVYCDPPSNQTTPFQHFEIIEDMILKGYADVMGHKITFENVEALSEVGSKAYYYTSGQMHQVIFLHKSKNCVVELLVSGNSDVDLRQQVIDAAKKIDENL